MLQTQKKLRSRQDFNRRKSTKRFQNWKKIQYYIQEGKCAYCRRSLKNQKFVTDHVKPLSIYGSSANRYDNYVLSCWSCNDNKSNAIGYTIPAWIQTRKRLLAKKNKKDLIKAYYLLRKLEK